MTESQPSRNAVADLIHGTRKLTNGDLRGIAHVSKVKKALRVRHEFKDKWPWGAAAEYLYRALIQALGLDEDEEEELLRLAKPKPGRKEERELAARILSLRAEGKTVSDILRAFEKENDHITRDGIESYLKTRRKRHVTRASGYV